MTFGDRFVAVLKARGLKPADLARRMRWAPGRVSTYFNQIYPPGPDLLQEIADAVGVDPMVLREGVRTKHDPAPPDAMLTKWLPSLQPGARPPSSRTARERAG